MSWTNYRRLAVACCTALFALNSAGKSRADCCLTDWLFGKGQTSYSLPYTPPTVYVPSTPAAACGCATVANYAPACPSCADHELPHCLSAGAYSNLHAGHIG